MRATLALPQGRAGSLTSRFWYLHCKHSVLLAYLETLSVFEDYCSVSTFHILKALKLNKRNETGSSALVLPSLLYLRFSHIRAISGNKHSHTRPNLEVCVCAPGGLRRRGRDQLLGAQMLLLGNCTGLCPQECPGDGCLCCRQSHPLTALSAPS